MESDFNIHPRFAPALTITEWLKENGYRFWTDEGWFHYDTLLISAARGINDLNWRTREQYDIPKDANFIGDSGGFQNITQDIRMNPNEVASWMRDNVDIGLGLDRPPIRKSDLNVIDDYDKFKYCARKSAENYQAQYDTGYTNEFDFLPVLHGGTDKEIRYWWEQMKDVPRDGIAISPKPETAPLVLAKQLAFIHDYADPDMIHVFLVSGMRISPILFYVGNKGWFDWFSFDSTSAHWTGMKFREYFMFPFKFENTGKKQGIRFNHIPCNCPVCRRFEDFKEMEEHHYTGFLIGLHNVWAYLNFYSKLQSITEDKEYLKQYIDKYGDEKILKAIHMIDTADEEGYDTMYEQHLSKATTSLSDAF